MNTSTNFDHIPVASMVHPYDFSLENITNFDIGVVANNFGKITKIGSIKATTKIDNGLYCLWSDLITECMIYI